MNFAPLVLPSLLDSRSPSGACALMCFGIHSWAAGIAELIVPPPRQLRALQTTHRTATPSCNLHLAAVGVLEHHAVLALRTPHGPESRHREDFLAVIGRADLCLRAEAKGRAQSR